MSNHSDYCTLYLVRHGETEWNKKMIIQGHTDAPLTSVGVRQIEDVANEFKDVAFDAIFSSDLLRAKRSAEIIRLERDLAIQTSELLRERAYGHFEGNTHENYYKEVDHLLRKMEDMPKEERWHFKIGEDVESDAEFIGRFILQLRAIAAAHPNKTALVVTHGGCIKGFLIHAGYGDYADFRGGAFQNAGYVKVSSDGVDFIIQDVKGIKKK